ncbi:ubiquitin related modifier 1 [Pancytospora philotis]|nr:ubiquitin related modifier 1 [Pancytospora philotis]
MRITFSGAEDEYLNTHGLDISQEVLAKEGIATLDDVVSYVYATEPRAHRSFFRPDGTLENGTVCLIDERHSEVLDAEEQRVDNNSSIVFISTMHGG